MEKKTVCWESPVKPWDKNKIIKVKLKMILSQYQEDLTFTVDYGDIEYWEKMGFEKRTSFYLKAVKEATNDILRKEPYRWFRQSVEFYPTNVTFEYDNCKSKRSTLTLSDLHPDIQKVNEDEKRIDLMEMPHVNTVQDIPRVFMTITMGLIPTRERVEELEERFKSTIHRDQKYFHLKNRPRLPSAAEIQTIKETEETIEEVQDGRSNEQMQAIEAKQLLQQFVYQMNQVNKTEMEFAKQMQKWIRLTNALLFKFARIDRTQPLVKIADWDEELTKPIKHLTKFQKRIAQANYKVASMMFYDNK
jgi:hypothetical protein